MRREIFGIFGGIAAMMVAAFLVYGFTSVLLYQPIPAWGVSEGQPIQNASANSNGQPPGSQQSAKNPAPISGVPASSQPRPEAANPTNNCEQPTSPDWWTMAYTGATAAFTFLLVVVGGVQAALFFWQLRLIRSSVKDAATASVAARDAADAAKQSAVTADRALTELERPFVFVKVRPPIVKVRNTGTGETNEEPDPTRVEVACLNYGRTPASITRFEVHVTTAARGGICDPIDASQIGGRELPVGTVSDRDDPFAETWELQAELSSNQITMLSKGRHSLWVTGFVRYRDILNNHYITGFTVVCPPGASAYVARGDEQYNYARKENRSDIPEPSSRG